MSNFLSVDIEGGDQVGKGDAVKNLSLELAAEGLDVNVISFPCYATPIGYAIRRILKEDLLNQYEMEPKDATSAKMAFFSLNRLEVLNSILSSEKSDIYVFDRGPFSNALTIAYALSTGLPAEEKEELVLKALSLDSYFRKSLNVDECIIRLFTKNSSWSKAREDDADLHESRDVQEISDSIYLMFRDILGESWVDIPSKDGNGWRERSDITNDCMTFVKKRVPISSVSGSKRPNYFSVGNTLRDLYKGSRVDQGALDLFMESVGSNNKHGMYQRSEAISSQVAGSVKEIQWYNEGIAGAVKDILDTHPEILLLLEQLYGEDFVIKLLKSVE